jgi:uncharacterized protein (TIGR02246 family)
MALGVAPLLLLIAAAAAAAAPQSSAPRATDERDVRAVVDRYVEARERRDAAAIGALFTADADQFTTGGEWRRGRDAVVRGALASSERTGGTRRVTIRAVRFPGRDMAIADGAYEIDGTRDGTARRMWTTFVMTRGAGGWRIAAIRNASPPTIPD